MVNFDFKKSSRKCFETGQAFKPGQEFVSVLIELPDGGTERRDYALEVWSGPPDDCIGWWKCCVPELGKGKVYWAPKSVLLAYFDYVRESPATTDTAFVTALLLSQKRILKLEDNGGDETIIRLKDLSTKTVFEVAVVDIEPKRLGEIQDELSERLFMDQPSDPDTEFEDVKMDQPEE